MHCVPCPCAGCHAHALRAGMNVRTNTQLACAFDRHGRTRSPAQDGRAPERKHGLYEPRAQARSPRHIPRKRRSARAEGSYAEKNKVSRKIRWKDKVSGERQGVRTFVLLLWVASGPWCAFSVLVCGDSAAPGVHVGGDRVSGEAACRIPFMAFLDAIRCLLVPLWHGTIKPSHAGRLRMPCPQPHKRAADNLQERSGPRNPRADP